MRHTCSAAIALTLAVWICAPVQAEGKLDSIRKSARSGSSSSSRKSSPSKSSCDDDDHDDSLAGELLGSLLEPLFEAFWRGMGYAVIAPVWGPRELLDDDWRRHGYFRKYPYADGQDAYLAVPKDESSGESGYDARAVGRSWSVQAAVEEGYDFEDVSFTTFTLRADTSSRWGLDASLSLLREDLPTGGTDELALGDVNLRFRFAQSERAQWHVGIGMRYMTDDLGTEEGINFIYGADFFPKEPWVLSGSVELGTLGHATVVEARATLGMMFDRWELYAGWNHLSIDDTTINGPVAGLRLWF